MPEMIDKFIRFELEPPRKSPLHSIRMKTSIQRWTVGDKFWNMMYRHKEMFSQLCHKQKDFGILYLRLQ